MPTIDLAITPLHELNGMLHALQRDTNETHFSVSAITAGLQAMGSRSTPKPDSVPTTKV